MYGWRIGAPPTLFRVSEATMQTPGADNAPRERDGLFEIVRWNNGERFSDEPQFRHALIRPARAEEVPQVRTRRTRVSKDEDGPRSRVYPRSAELSAQVGC